MRRPAAPDEATFYALVIDGPWHAEAFPEVGPADGFITRYQVVAECPDEALGFIRAFEPPEIRDAPRIDEIEDSQPTIEPKGVYWASDHYFYQEG